MVHVIFLWMPSHVGIDGLDFADEYTKESLKLPKSSKIKLQIKTTGTACPI